MWSKAWTVIVGIGVIATILSWAETSKWLPHWLAVLAVAPIWSLLSTLAIFALLAWAMWQFGKLFSQADADRQRRDQQFQSWLSDRGNAVESLMETRYARLAQRTEQAEQRIVDLIDNFHKTYNTRLIDVETMGVEGPWVRLTLGQRTFTLTTFANDFYLESRAGLRKAIERGLAYGMRERWSRESLRRACGDYYKPEGSKTEWFFDDIASMTTVARQALLSSEPALSVWFNRQERLRITDDGL